MVNQTIDSMIFPKYDLFIKHLDDTKEVRLSTYLRLNIDGIWCLMPINQKYDLLEDKHTNDITVVYQKEILKCIEMFVDYVYCKIIGSYTTKEEVEEYFKRVNEDGGLIMDDFNVEYDKELCKTRQLTERERLNIDWPRNTIAYYGEDEKEKKLVEEVIRMVK